MLGLGDSSFNRLAPVLLLLLLLLPPLPPTPTPEWVGVVLLRSSGQEPLPGCADLEPPASMDVVIVVVEVWCSGVCDRAGEQAVGGPDVVELLVDDEESDVAACPDV